MNMIEIALVGAAAATLAVGGHRHWTDSRADAAASLQLAQVEELALRHRRALGCALPASVTADAMVAAVHGAGTAHGFAGWEVRYADRATTLAYAGADQSLREALRRAGGVEAGGSVAFATTAGKRREHRGRRDFADTVQGTATC